MQCIKLEAGLSASPQNTVGKLEAKLDMLHFNAKLISTAAEQIPYIATQ
jgi:hypothetical protein